MEPKAPKAPKTNAQRQAEYRRRCRTRKEGYSSVLHTQLDYGAKYELERLAHYHGLTQRQLLEQLIHNHYNRVTKDLPEEQFDLFQDKKLIVTK